MYSFTVPDKAKPLISPDETVLWVGQSESFPLMNKDSKTSLLIRFIICGILLIAFTLGYALYCKYSGTEFSAIACIIGVAILAFLVWAPFGDRRTVLRSSKYVLTDKKAIQVGKNDSLFVMHRDNSGIKLEPMENGCVTVLLGSAMKLPRKKWVSASAIPIHADDGNGIAGMVFYNVKKTDELINAI